MPFAVRFGADPRAGAIDPTPMPSILFADHDFPDIDLERALFARAGLELVLAQCRTEDGGDRARRAVARRSCCSTRRSPRAVVAALPDLGIVSRIGAGFDTVDTNACEAHGVWVANSPDYGVGEVATHALALALASLRNVVALPPRHPRRPLALPVVRAACAARPS